MLKNVQYKYMNVTKGKNNHSAKTTEILECVCVSQFQDERYGKQKRVHNPTATGYKCTVCNKTRTKS